ncbi:MAG: hypothetical protein QNJ62_06720 [Methyloceanibacter sp.]|nr:hypothetical protein [Methyloceanibacter sp.]
MIEWPWLFLAFAGGFCLASLLLGGLVKAADKAVKSASAQLEKSTAQLEDSNQRWLALSAKYDKLSNKRLQ